MGQNVLESDVVTAAEKITAAAASEKTEQVDSREAPGSSRAWDAKAVID